MLFFLIIEVGYIYTHTYIHTHIYTYIYLYILPTYAIIKRNHYV